MYPRAVLRGSFAFVLFAGALTAPASAQDARVVTLVAPPECPDEPMLRARLDDALAASGEGVLPDVAAAVDIRREDGGYAATVTIRDGEHETTRSIADPSCSLLVDATVLIVAVALVPGLGGDVSGDADLAAAPLVDAVAEDLPGSPHEPEPSRVGPRVSGALRLAVHGVIGALPGVAVGGEVGGGVRYDALRVDLAVRALPLVGARFAVDPALGADLALAVVLVRALAVATLDPRAELYAGGGLEVGAEFGRGVGISVPRDAAAPWVALEGAVGVAWLPWPVVAFVLEVEVIVPVVRPVFVASGVGVLYRPDPVAGALRLGIEARFP